MSDSSPISNSCMFVYLQDLDIADMVHTEAKLATRPETDYDIGLLSSLYICQIVHPSLILECLFTNRTWIKLIWITQKPNLQLDMRQMYDIGLTTQ